MLKIRNLQAAYGASQVLFGVDLDVAAGEVVTLLGRNGMGKTTSVHAMTGVHENRQGEIELEGRRIEGLASHLIAKLGIGLVPEGRQIFPNLTVRENLVATAANREKRANPWTLARAYEFFPRLAERESNMGNQLSGGEQQMLAVGRALAGAPKVLLLDEPMEGLAPVIVDTLFDAFSKIRDEGGMTIILVEQKVDLALAFASNAIILDRGQIVYRDTCAALKADEAAQHNYLGVGAELH